MRKHRLARITSFAMASILVVSAWCMPIMGAAAEAGLEQGRIADSGRAATKSCSTLDEAVAYLRAQMAARETSVSFSIPLSIALANGGNTVCMENVMESAISYFEGCSGTEGDALRWSRAGYGAVPYPQSDGTVVFTYTISYHSTAAQENELTDKVNTVMASLALDGKTDYEKVRAIHDWICDNVDYEYDTGNTARYSAYSAAIKGKSVCQGYAVLFYRMCKEAGLEVRIVGGTNSAGGAHGWNLVQVADAKARAGGKWYNVDCTWDGQTKTTRHDYFMKSDADFNLTHIRSSEYASYPTASESWSMDEGGSGWNLVTDWNKQEVKLPFPFPQDVMTSNGGQLSYLNGGSDYYVKSDSSAHNKIYMFIQPTCPRSAGVAASINSNMSKFIENNIDVYLISTDYLSKKISSFKSAMGSPNAKINFMYNGQDLQNDWLNEVIHPAGHDIAGDTPIIVYLDAKNLVQYASFGTISADTILQNIKKYCSGAAAAVNFNKITYHLDGGTNNPDNPAEYLAGSVVITLSVPTKEGYTFKGWRQGSASGTAISQITNNTSGDLELYAAWEQNPTITYMLDGGTNHPENPSSYTKGDNEIILKDPTKEGFAFLGWYTDEAKVTLLAGSKLVTTADTGNVTLYAK